VAFSDVFSRGSQSLKSDLAPHFAGARRMKPDVMAMDSATFAARIHLKALPWLQDSNPGRGRVLFFIEFVEVQLELSLGASRSATGPGQWARQHMGRALCRRPCMSYLYRSLPRLARWAVAAL